ncbi:MAG: Tad domain-containing protein [Marinobacter sp.]|uniref:Tad domain-containing protein n=1 Tax=Marinobacter sp. TaxID=50741 RepID=UPI0032976687
MHYHVSHWFLKRIYDFKEDEDGGIMILSLMLFVCMIVAGGLAVDLANYERSRTYLQTHLDNAVLGAASLSQNMDPKEVVLSYMASSGVDTSAINVETDIEQIGGIVVGRTVYASMDDEVRTFFFRYFNHDTLGMKIESRAVERVEDIEISLALDVSGSMSDPTSDRSERKIDALKEAASGFVDEVLSEAEEGRVSISIIPYSTKVNAGADLLNYYNATTEHEYSHCVDFEANDFRTLSIYPSSLLQRTAHFQFSEWSVYDPSAGIWTCRIDPGFEITPLSSSATELKAQIDGSVRNFVP